MNDKESNGHRDERSNGRSLVVLLSRTVMLFGFAAMTVHFAGRLLWPEETKYYFNRRESWIERLQPSPAIVFMGSSTVLYGVSPSIVQRQLGLPEGSVVNLALNARSPLGSNSVWNQERPTLSRAKIVVYGLDPWILSAIYYSSDDFTSLHYSLWQAFYQAVHPPGLRHLNLAAFGGPALLNVVHGIQTYHARVDQPIPPIPPDYGAKVLYGRPLNYTHADRVREYFGTYPTYGISELYLERFAELKRQVEAAGATFVLLLPPKRSKWSESYRRDCRDIDSD
ncbi:MAG TPA: hypothetical protein VFD13_02370, partial [Candidatus Kapabacteria bacterium]|nr:hypothetical protein [Candidatus Kapabacteria bacterium]